MTIKISEDYIATLTKKLDFVLFEMKEDRQRAIEDRQKTTATWEYIATFFQTQQNIAENNADKEQDDKDPPNNGHNGDARTGPSIHESQINLKFLVFNETDPKGWIFKAGQYFPLIGVQEAKKVSMDAIILEGDSISWYRWSPGSLEELTWEQFSNTIWARFSSRKSIDPCGSLSKLGQIGVHMLRHESLSEAFDLTNFQEETIDVISRFKATKSTQVVSTPATTTNSTVVPVRRISKFEQDKRRKQGLCFHCDEIYKPGHLCKRAGQVLLLEADNDVFIMNYSKNPI